MQISVNQNGWAITNLESIETRITKGGTPTTYGFSFQNSGINFLKVENIEFGRVNLKSVIDFIGQDAHDFQSKSKLDINDILFSIAGTIGETCLIKAEVLWTDLNKKVISEKFTEKDKKVSPYIVTQLLKKNGFVKKKAKKSLTMKEVENRDK